MSRPHALKEGKTFSLHKEKIFSTKRTILPLRKNLRGVREPWSTVSIYLREHSEREMKDKGYSKANQKLNRALAYLEQSQEFYNVAKEATNKTKAMLVYYSMLNFAKSIIEVKKENPNFSHHGVWVPSLPAWARLRLAELELKEKGVFRELSELIGYRYSPKDTVKGEQVFINCTGCKDEVKSVWGRNIYRISTHLPVMQWAGHEKWLECSIPRSEVNKFKSRSVKETVDKISQITNMKWVSLPKEMSKEYLGFQSEPIEFRGRSAPREIYRWLNSLDEWLEETFHADTPYYSIRLPISSASPIPSTIAIFLGMYYLNHLSRYCPDHLDRMVFHKDYHLAQVFMETQPIEFFLALASYALNADFYYV